MWNFLIFLLLPPNTILGPITGGALFTKKFSINYLIRSILFPICYKISDFILNYRYNKLIFATDLLKRFLSSKTIKKSKFNYVLGNIKIEKKKNKKVDLIIYYRKHKNKLIDFPNYLITYLASKQLKIIVVGDTLKIKNVKNYGFVKNKTIKYLQSISKFTIASSENIYSLFVTECINNNVKILISEINKRKIKYFKKYFIPVNFKKTKYLSKLIING